MFLGPDATVMRSFLRLNGSECQKSFCTRSIGTVTVARHMTLTPRVDKNGVGRERMFAVADFSAV